MLMEEKYNMRKSQSIHQGSPNIVSPWRGEETKVEAKKSVGKEKEEVTPHKLIRIKEVMGMTNAASPTRGRTNDKGERRSNFSVVKRKNVTVYKTEPDDMMNTVMGPGPNSFSPPLKNEFQKY